MTTVTCTRLLHWDAAHRIVRHESKCASLHGHRYTAEITCTSDDLDTVGRVVDFGVIKERVGQWIDAHWDHTTLVALNDADLIRFLQQEAQRGRKPCYIMRGEPTAENIALELLRVASELLDDSRLRVIKVRVYETPNAYADAHADPAPREGT